MRLRNYVNQVISKATDQPLEKVCMLFMQEQAHTVVEQLLHFLVLPHRHNLEQGLQLQATVRF